MPYNEETTCSEEDEEEDPRWREYVEISVETLMGTDFELRLLRDETIGNIKTRLMRLEGIPAHHMNILYSGRELADELSIRDCGIRTGDSLQLVLTLRGGPINTKRVSIPVPTSSSSHHHYHRKSSNRKKRVIENFSKSGQMTVVMLRDGNRVNLYHVLDEAGNTGFSPSSLSDSLASGSLKNFLGSLDKTSEKMLERKEEYGLSSRKGNPEVQKRLRENAITMSKMKDLKSQLESLSLNKKANHNSKQKPGLSDSSVLPPIHDTASKGLKLFDDDDGDFCTITPLHPYKKPSSSSSSSSWSRKVLSSSSRNSTSSSKVKDVDLLELQRVGNELEIIQRRRTQPLITADISLLLMDNGIRKGDHYTDLRRYRRYSGRRRKNKFGENAIISSSSSSSIPPSPRQMVKRQQSSRSGSGISRRSSRLKRKKLKKRCGEKDCRKKLTNPSNTYACRCNRLFCIRHRYPETHSCNFDFKKEGRRILENANPIVTLPKLPKI